MTSQASRRWIARPSIAALALAALFVPAAARADPPGPARLIGVQLVSRIGRAPVADDRPKRALARDGVRLYAVLVARDGAHTAYYSDAGPVVEIGGKRRPARPLAEAPAARLAWFKVEPRVESMSNTESGQFRFEPIDYAETEVERWRGQASVAADVRPTLTTDRWHGIGTMRFKLRAATASGTFATPGAEARRGRGSGGLGDAVQRVSLRRDDSYIGFLGELFGQPYIWASAGTSNAAHQSERLEGADCADFVIYGRRRMGEDRDYTWTGALPQVTRLLAAGRPGKGGVYLDARGRPLPFPQVGDLVLFPRHVGVLVEDRGRPGVLDGADLLLHAYFASPRAQPLGETDYRDAPVELRRWR
ncbi:MAG TPA: hypothetical protein VKB80_08020 [Kofleriaceae bacterium]|nr:hypothetical protein [Kofleriaceae bacterium]